ncbi:uncharacterized protein EI97DRAFT_42919 [Westerdykella ornata]|uniref:Chitin-binding type-1 domain-containing protein n=1 Tax=Westerdykella ornata TaxID=318751 RepID=A0A6A6JJS7_WESOR|nr:uncharacterized protein EI97DRAFT_42919 [Westerdykella ornata]KAF2276514.1 hypothetical protein EI97DRAFT_42919 [Westerdykella ornata]
MGSPSEYSLDGKCGYRTTRSSVVENGVSVVRSLSRCVKHALILLTGTGPAYCGLGTYQSGNCTLPTPGETPSASSITSTGAPTPTPGSISPDGRCGSTNRFTCKGSSYGDCCSSSGFCGSTAGHCGGGCQSAFGDCTITDISPDGTCGGTNEYKCKGSAFGDCCSLSGYCGSTTDHCTAGCQAAFGICTDDSLSPDGTCGGTKGYRCKGTSFGSCCSSAGYCGSSADHCGVGCQSTFGDCSLLPPTKTSATPPTPTDISQDGTCGGTKRLKCHGSTFGNCCSSNGYCGNGVNFCAQGCQTPFSSACMTSNIPTLNGDCGASKGGFTCTGGPFDGQCCSASGYCGSTDAHCKSGCPRNYGTCK